MTMPYGMSSSEQLNMLLDGELHSAEAPGLFYELSQNHELQEEMFELIKLKNMMKVQQPAPKDKLKAGILAGIGLSGAGTIYTAANSTGSAFLSGKLLIGGAAAVLSSILTFFTVTGFGGNDSGDPQPGRNNRGMASVRQAGIPSVSSTETSGTNGTLPVKENTVERVRIVYVERERPQSVSPGISSGNGQAVAPEEMKISSVDMKNIEKPYNDNMLTEGTYVIAPVFKSSGRMRNEDFERSGEEYLFMQSAGEEPLSGLKLEFRGFSSNHFQELNLPLANDPAINNISMGLFYDLNERYSAGLEFGQENFYQKFIGINGTKTFPIEQNSVQFWGVGVFRYSAGRLEALGGVQPFAQVGLGSTNAALMSRFAGGLRYDFSNKFGVFAAMELTSLYYKSNSVWNTTNKAGLTYGITLKF